MQSQHSLSCIEIVRILLVCFIEMVVMCERASAAAPQLLLMGDSITSALGEQNVGRCNTVNAAKGGTGVLETLEKAGGIQKKYDAVLIAIGINDTKKNKLTSSEVAAWNEKYRNLVSQAKQISSAVYLSTILPTETDKSPYGDYSDQNLLKQFNSVIKKVAAQMRVKTIDSNAFFTNEVSNFTLDGVHPSETGSTRLRTFWTTQILECKKQ